MNGSRILNKKNKGKGNLIAAGFFAKKPHIKPGKFNSGEPRKPDFEDRGQNDRD